MNCKNALSLALLAGISGLSPIAMAANPPAAQMDSVPVEASANAAALGGAELRSLASGSTHAPRLIELGAPDSAQAATMRQLRGQQVKHGQPLQIGFSRTIAEPAIDLRRLSWHSLPDGAQVTSFEIVSTGAAALRAALQLSGSGAQPGDPGKATLRFAGNDGRVFEQSGADFAGREPGWSAAVSGARLVVEIELPAGQYPQGFALKIPQLSHMDINPVASEAMMRPMIGESGSCEHDIVCRANPSSGFTSAAKSVARMLFSKGGSTYVCTGTLLNNSNSPKKYLFWTAAHCISTQAVADTVQTYWFYDAATCNGSTVSASAATLSGGASLRYANTTRDTALLELKTAPPSGAFYAGWNSSAIGSTGTAIEGIHHPAGDVKKYSLGSVSTLSSSSGDRSPLYEVVWNSGVTEGGSSGSGLFTVNSSGAYQLRGGLLGGDSSCGAPSAPDYYSRFSDVYSTIQPYLSP
ncbi:trypsin-like serine peptidase [Xanthomonas translucens]|uniref:Endoproteinase ArgC n=4 Tax=Xanthomonas campestris pv. translucens TaxID=343 RepID=A0A109HQ93_XANCT|nr:trypsin-like peptidase domain-containing protein [Xanthomonas translucens]KWV15909.1 endoproteinase ArgC [Xanthomonas translucens]KWV16468.1 endoproteinase ArgC [Xanthomonas translucens]MCC8445034.1 trypsin-like peptidase domain-containing protein [Xanthomonas translucens pv. translucens]MCS3359918.1 trypsin-like peptidase domain-containing protein [Xanthomonas translucens pv. translucens]MCS3372327.1 trypsin-like peptidase domain-containing protein [Xanthomonas translucens pv. translucens]